MENKMPKKEKIIAICFIISMILLIISCITTLTINKPQGYSFNVERLIHKIL